MTQPLSDYSKIRALVADESNASREALASTLRSLGLTRIDMAHGKADALNLLSQRSPDLILCDYHLGTSSSGQALLEEGRRRELISPHCVFIMVTSERDRKMIMAAAEWQPDDYLLKPFTAQALLSRVERFLSLKYPLQKAAELLKLGEFESATTELYQYLAERSKNASQKDASRSSSSSSASSARLSTENTKEGVASGFSATNISGGGTGGSIGKAVPIVLDSQTFQPVAVKLLIDTLLKTGQAQQALTLSTQASSLTEAAWAKLAKAKSLMASGSAAQAIPLFSQLIDANPHFMKARDELQMAYQLTGQFFEAQKVIEESLLISPHNTSRHSELGVAAFRAGDYSKAISHLEQGMHTDQLSHMQIDTWAHLVNALLEEGNAEKAYSMASSMSEDSAASTEQRQIALSLMVRAQKSLGHSFDAMHRILIPLKEAFEAKTLESKARPYAVAAAYSAQDVEFAEAALLSALKSQSGGNPLDFSYLKMVLHKLGHGHRFQSLQDQVAQQRVQEIARVRQYQQAEQWQEAAYYLIDLASLSDASIVILHQASVAIVAAQEHFAPIEDGSIVVSQFLVRARQINPYHPLVLAIDSALKTLV